jgi:hypothetical protein
VLIGEYHGVVAFIHNNIVHFNEPANTTILDLTLGGIAPHPKFGGYIHPPWLRASNNGKILPSTNFIRVCSLDFDDDRPRMPFSNSKNVSRNYRSVIPIENSPSRGPG